MIVEIVRNGCVMSKRSTFSFDMENCRTVGLGVLTNHVPGNLFEVW